MGRGAKVGIAVGLSGGIAVSGMLRTQLYAVAPWDIPTAAAVCGVVALVALAACLVPAARAARLDPVTALRAE